MYQEITENGVTYAVIGDYPNGIYTKYPKPALYSEPLKTVYAKVDFLNSIPKHIRKQISALIRANDEEAVDWKFIVDAMDDEVNLNELPDGFVEGLDYFAGHIDVEITQAQVDNFLER